ncbi:unnamed protein product [Blepharisma stoltei]|uniref:ISXO2-like transposase domain-containing protein n=1 Tax=Blepharisma stoltei TaxID=1481888 RepID=A0AAU9JS12_9CILI|nr:unnamed protein product [Blepharisma stoltei]
MTDEDNPTEVWTDGWKAYNKLENDGFRHRVVFHNRSFGSGRETTNHIENLWSRLKKLRAFSNGFKANNEEDLDDYVMYFQFLLTHKGLGRIPAFIEALMTSNF